MKNKVRIAIVLAFVLGLTACNKANVEQSEKTAPKEKLESIEEENNSGSSDEITEDATEDLEKETEESSAEPTEESSTEPSSEATTETTQAPTTSSPTTASNGLPTSIEETMNGHWELSAGMTGYEMEYPYVLKTSYHVGECWIEVTARWEVCNPEHPEAKTVLPLSTKKFKWLGTHFYSMAYDGPHDMDIGEFIGSIQRFNGLSLVLELDDGMLVSAGFWS